MSKLKTSEVSDIPVIGTLIMLRFPGDLIGTKMPSQLLPFWVKHDFDDTLPTCFALVIFNIGVKCMRIGAAFGNTATIPAFS